MKHCGRYFFETRIVIALLSYQRWSYIQGQRGRATCYLPLRTKLLRLPPEKGFIFLNLSGFFPVPASAAVRSATDAGGVTEF